MWCVCCWEVVTCLSLGLRDCGGGGGGGGLVRGGVCVGDAKTMAPPPPAAGGDAWLGGSPSADLDLIASVLDLVIIYCRPWYTGRYQDLHQLCYMGD